jgi:hypothetical protein
LTAEQILAAGGPIYAQTSRKDDLMKMEDVHVSLATEILSRPPNEEDALALMVLLHTHHIRLKSAILEDRPGVMELAAITQRHAAEVLAATWPDRADAQRTNHAYWYHQFNARTPYEVVEDIPPDWMARVHRLRELLAGNPVVNTLEPED